MRQVPPVHLTRCRLRTTPAWGQIPAVCTQYVYMPIAKSRSAKVPFHLLVVDNMAKDLAACVSINIYPKEILQLNRYQSVRNSAPSTAWRSPTRTAHCTLWSSQEGALAPSCIAKPGSAEDVASIIATIANHEGCRFAIKSQGQLLRLALRTSTTGLPLT
jgi:hypothetical protein